MPTTIPYDSSLVLGNLIDDTKIEKLKAIANLQKPADDAETKLNSLITIKHKLDMTLQEMLNLGVEDLTEYSNELETVKKQVADAATKYGQAQVASAKAVADFEDSQDQDKISEMPESPIDCDKSNLKTIALSSDSISLNVQYLRNEEEEDSNKSHASSVASAVSGSAGSLFGPRVSAQLSASVKQSALSQTSQHEIEGTLVITAHCTHENADVFSPFVMDPDKAMDAWNMLAKANGGSEIDPLKESSLKEALKDDKSSPLKLLSGQTKGSSFVGMVHVLQTESTSSSQSSSATSAAASASMEWGGMFANYSGKFGVDSSFSDSVKQLLSQSNISAHCCLVTMGIIPSIKSDLVTTSISSLKPDAKEVMDQLATIQGATDKDVNSASAAANNAKAGQQYIELNNSYVKNVVSSVHEAQNKDNKMIDINSLMTAFDDYVERAGKGSDSIGVPINFYIKEIGAKDVAFEYLKKYSPLRTWQMGDEKKDDQNE